MKKEFVLVLAFSILLPFWPGEVSAQEADPDYDAYLKYELYLNYDKKVKYKKYKKYKKAKKKYGFKNSAEKFRVKENYKKYKEYKKNPRAFPQYAKLYDDYKKYSRYKKYYSPYKKYARYGKYKKYDKKKYDEGKNYGSSHYRQAHDRYLKSLKNGGLGEATLGGGPLGPEISVGLYNYTKSDLRDSTYVRVRATKDYNVKNSSGAVVATVPADTYTRVKYSSGGSLVAYESIAEIECGGDVYFESADGNNADIIFDLNRPGSDFDQYRGRINVHFFDSPESDGDRIWIINFLPLEHYVWGIGEITGTGDMSYNRAMTVMFRTYGYWKIKYSTQFSAQGFKVINTSSNQIYHGYDWEKNYSRIRQAAEETRGKLMMYGDEIALSPYSSWTDGRTRSFEERWGSKLYPWCQSVSDPYGKHPTMGTSELQAAGNHMVGLSANGALSLARDHGWNWEKILKYYFTGVRFLGSY